MFLLWGKHVRKYYPKYFIFFLIGLAALVTVDFFQLKIPNIIGSVVDELNENGFIDPQSETFVIRILSVITVAVVMLIGRVIWRISLFYASRKMEEHVRQEMFLKAERLDVTYYHNTKVGNIMSWFTNDIETLEEFLGWGSLMMIDGTFLTIFALTKMFILNSSLAIIALFPILLIALWGALVEGKMSYIWKLRQESNDELYDFSQESFTGIRVIKAFVKEHQQIIAFDKMAHKNKDINVRFTYISVIFDVMIELIIALVIAVINGFGGWFVWGTVTGNPTHIFGRDILLSAGQLIEFIGYFTSVIWPMIAIGQVVTMLSKSRASYKRIAAFLDAPEDVKDSEDAVDVDIKGNIEFKHFNFAYPGNEDRYDLKDINLSIKAGENIGIIGSVGSGKTTLVNMLLRLYNVEANTLFIDGVDIMKIKMKSLREAVSMTPQDNFLFSDTIQNNIAFYDIEQNKERVVEAAEFADVNNDIMDFENKYESVLGENGHTVSGGQKQRISLARSYLKNAPIMILDDSVSAVDLKTEENILKNIKEKRSGKTTIIIASRVSTVMNLDKVIVMNHGAVEAFDTPKKLLKQDGTFAKMAALQELEKEKGGSL